MVSKESIKTKYFALKGIRPIQSTIKFLLKLYTVVECYMESEKVK